MRKGEEVVLVLLWGRTSKKLGRQSWASRGQTLVNGRDLSSNSPSGGNLGLISEVLKVGFYGVCHILRPFVSDVFFITQRLIVMIMRKWISVFFPFWILSRLREISVCWKYISCSISRFWCTVSNIKSKKQLGHMVTFITLNVNEYSLSNLVMMSLGDSLPSNTAGSNSSSL